MNGKQGVVVTGSFDDLRSHHVRFLEEASRLGSVHVALWSDETVRLLEEKDPRLPQQERQYLLQAIRHVREITLITGHVDVDALPQIGNLQAKVWAVHEGSDSARKRAFCLAHGVEYHVLTAQDLAGFAMVDGGYPEKPSSRPKVMVTGCFDWLHSGHVRFFEEASGLGDLHVVVGHDANVRLLKGEGHPTFSQDERRYMVQAIRYVQRALISSGHGWMDAEPEITWVKPDLYVVNEDGDKLEKRAFCREHGIEYVVLRRLPKEGLPRRDGTSLRGY